MSAATTTMPTHWRFQNLTGQTFGRWTVLRFAYSNERRKSFWRCRCQCGNENDVVSHSLVSGESLSCGCWDAELVAQKVSTHGMARTPEHQAWCAIKSRCCSPTDKNWTNYGGRGIYVCDRWRDSFEAFYADMGPRPSDRHSIERKNNDGPYSPENCVWATAVVQQRNKRSNRFLTYRDKTQTVVGWSEELGIPQYIIHNRLRAGWPTDAALTTPIEPRAPRRKSGH